MMGVAPHLAYNLHETVKGHETSIVLVWLDGVALLLKNISGRPTWIAHDVYSAGPQKGRHLGVEKMAVPDGILHVKG